MTSPASRNPARKPARANGSIRVPSPPAGAGARLCLRRRGLTLVELILTLALVAVLFSAVVLNAYGWGQSARLEEGARRFETLVLMARAEAANVGRALKLEFAEGEDGWVETRILWQGDPLADPQAFSEYAACMWRHHLPTGLVSVASSRRTGPSAYRLLETEMADADEGEPLESLTFYPDGSCDSAVVELVSTSERDERTAVIEIEGLTGTVTRKVLTPVDY